MPRKPSNEAKTRLNLELTERVRERLEKIRTLSEADSLTEVIRRALTVYDTLLTAVREEGGQIVLRKPDGTDQVIVLS